MSHFSPDSWVLQPRSALVWGELGGASPARMILLLLFCSTSTHPGLAEVLEIQSLSPFVLLCQQLCCHRPALWIISVQLHKHSAMIKEPIFLLPFKSRRWQTRNTSVIFFFSLNDYMVWAGFKGKKWVFPKAQQVSLFTKTCVASVSDWGKFRGKEKEPFVIRFLLTLSLEVNV